MPMGPAPAAPSGVRNLRRSPFQKTPESPAVQIVSETLGLSEPALGRALTVRPMTLQPNLLHISAVGVAQSTSPKIIAADRGLPKSRSQIRNGDWDGR